MLYFQLDRLRGDAAAAELFGVRRFMSCDSVRRNFASIPAEEALAWVWRENLRLLQDVVAEDCVLDLDPTVKPVYGRPEGAELGYSPQKPGRPSHCCHTLCIAKLRLTLAVVVHPGVEASVAADARQFGRCRQQGGRQQREVGQQKENASSHVA